LEEELEMLNIDFSGGTVSPASFDEQKGHPPIFLGGKKSKIKTTPFLRLLSEQDPAELEPVDFRDFSSIGPDPSVRAVVCAHDLGLS
jgi:hypothetical protein